MLTKNEITALNLSPTKKDFVQIWNELLEVAGKLSERWDPTSTNESDPGIVLLKALTGIADKLNYNIDKNILEAFMPTAAQEDSMRKLCDMLGYNMKYYRSAETDVTIKYYNADPDDDETKVVGIHGPGGLSIPKFTVITNSDRDVNYFTTNSYSIYISKAAPSITLPCMEGQIVKCESSTADNVITLSQLSSNNKFYLPEYQIAENGIFIYNAIASGNTLTDGTAWEKVDNLNIQPRGSRVFKFGYDSYEGRPYVEFPEDCSELIKDGLFIYYTRTSGANGNISAGTLTQLELPSTEGWSKVSAESFSVVNNFATTSGAGAETIKQAYNNFKKTIGTFETLVTCRDYMNKIYSMLDDNGKPYVSNALVTDIRTDINRAITICSCDDAGIFYKETPLTESKKTERTVTIKTATGAFTTGTFEESYEEPAISHFDLVLYPFKSYTNIRNNVKDIQATYDSSFKYSDESFDKVEAKLKELNVKTIAHNIIKPRKNDIISINNYLRLDAIIGTNSKITTEEGNILKETIKIALANAFNMRELDFSEEIPFESIVEVIENADPRIKVVSLNEPALYTTFSVYEGEDNNSSIIREYAVASDNWLTEEEADATGRFEYTDGASKTFDTKEAREFYNKLVVRNILAGRVPLFKYNNTFSSSFNEGAYQETTELTEFPTELAGIWNESDTEPAVYVLNGVTYNRKPVKITSPETGLETITAAYTKTAAPNAYKNNIVLKDSADTDKNITEIETRCVIKPSFGSPKFSDITLAAGERVKFRAPNFTTTVTYPAYVNYHLQLNRPSMPTAENAVAKNLYSLITDNDSNNSKKSAVLDFFKNINKKKTFSLAQAINIENIASTPAIENPPLEIPEDGYGKILFNSGFVKIANNGHPILKLKDSGEVFNIGELSWKSANTKTVEEALNIINQIEDNDSYITNVAVFGNIKTYVDGVLKDLKTLDNEWIISYQFDYVPFDASTLEAWEAFVLTNCNTDENTTTIFGNVAIDPTAVLWRLYSGNIYSSGKYITEGGAKLLPFSNEYFSLIDKSTTNRLAEIYVASYLGKDAEVSFIANDEEYELQEDEYLYIEYTPSTTTEEGTSQTSDPETKIHGPGTILKPAGFENGLIDSTSYANKGHSATKTVDFGTPGSPIEKNMFSFGANEQVEIREPSAVTLNKDLFENSAAIWIYKNFNDCPELEEITNDTTGLTGDGERINNSYTLKDGEYIFYTDYSKAEFAYFTTGTKVTLTGKTFLPKFEVIDISTIFDSGIESIPWYQLNFTNVNQSSPSKSDGIRFEEYQYITLGAEDTLTSLTLSDVGANYKYQLDSTWRKCENISYKAAGTSEKTTLPKINVTNGGWEVCSTLELNASTSKAQSLRNTGNVATSVVLKKTNVSTGAATGDTIELKVAEGQQPLSFKTNLTCQSSNGKVKLSDVYNNPNAIKSFELKVFNETPPEVFNTIAGKLLPYSGPELETVSKNSENAKLTMAGYNETFNSIGFTALTPVSGTVGGNTITYDRAIKLPVSILPNTYGVFSVYINYSKNAIANEAETWIEFLPGVSAENTVEIFNGESKWIGTNKLLLTHGINCVRVKDTCDLYIKANAKAVGTLYFDNLRLVDAVKIEYLDKDTGKVMYGTSQGLNLDQLGYLDAKDESTLTVFDARTRKQLKAEYRDEALKALDEKQQKYDAEYSDAYSKLTDIRPKLYTLEEVLDKAAEEIDTLYNEGGSDFTTLAELLKHFKDVYDDLANEKALKAALLNNESIKILESELTGLLGDSAAIETTKQELLAKLEELKEIANNNLESAASTLPNADILVDFDKYALVTGNELAKLVDNLKVASLLAVDKNYSNQVALAIEDMLNIESAYSETIQQLSEKLYAIEHVSLLTRIKNALSEAAPDIQAILSELKLAYDISDSEILANLITKITLATNSNDASSSIKTAIIGEIDLILTDNTSFDTTLGVIKNNAEDHIKAIANRITTYASAKAGYVTKTTSFTPTSGQGTSILSKFNGLPFYKEAIVEVWPRYALPKIEELYEDIGNVIRSLTHTDNTLTHTISSPLLIKLTNVAAFEDLYTDVIIFVQKATQSSKRDLLIESVSNQIDLAQEVSAAMKVITTNSKDRNSAINNLITQLTATSPKPSAKKKQQLLDALIEELDNEIKLDEQLVSICANVLCPHFLLYKDYLPSDDAFYTNANTFMKQQWTDLLDPSKTNADNLNEKLAEIKSELTNKTVVVSTFIDTYLSGNVDTSDWNGYDTEGDQVILSGCDALVDDIKLAVAKQAKITEAKDYSLFTTYLSDYLGDDNETKVAWQILNAKNERVWKDSAGKDLTLSSDVYTDTNGNIVEIDLARCIDVTGTPAVITRTWWKDCASDSEIEITKNSGVWSIDTKTLDSTDEVDQIIVELLNKLEVLSDNVVMTDTFKDVYDTLKLENQLLEDIRAIDKDRSFYYNVQIEPNIAIDFNEGDKKRNTLMNPAVNYDINNINNSFVISKLDINYLTKGLQIARSSRIN